MDNRVTAVLDIYHEMMRKEKEQGHSGPQGIDLDSRLLAVGPQTGRLINILSRSLKTPTILELGTSYGYSGIWLAEAARAAEGRVITMEVSNHKSAFACEMSQKAGLADHVDFRVGDAVEMIGELDCGLDFVLVDLWKDLYLPCLKAFLPKLRPGAIIVADNISPGRANIADYVAAIRALPDMASFPVPVGSGLEISRYRAWT